MLAGIGNHLTFSLASVETHDCKRSADRSVLVGEIHCTNIGLLLHRLQPDLKKKQVVCTRLSIILYILSFKYLSLSFFESMLYW